MSTFSSVARTALTITNALNLAQLRGASDATEKSRIQHELAEAYRDYNRAIAEGNKEAEQDALERIGILKNELSEFEKRREYESWQDFLTQANAAILGVSTVFNVLLKSETIRNAVFKAASSLGALFGGVFTGFSTLVIKAGQWLWGALFAPSVASKSALGGATHGGIFAGAFSTISNAIVKIGAWLNALFYPHTFARTSIGGSAHGATFGAAFAVAAQIALVAGLIIAIASALDIIIESFTGFSFMRKLTDAIFGQGNGFSVRDFLGIPMEGASIIDSITGNAPSSSTLFEQNERGEKFGGKPFGIDLQGIGMIPDSPEIINFKDLMETQLPESYEANEDAFNQTWLTDIPTSLTESSTTLKEGFTSLWNSIIGTTNSAGETLTTGMNAIFQGLIAHINSLIEAYNRAAKKLGKPTIAKVKFTPATFTSLDSIPTVAAAKGFHGMVNSPTLFLAGEAGPEAVNITPNSSSSGASTVTVINVHGSIMAERELLKLVDNDQKSRLKKRGFTGF